MKVWYPPPDDWDISREFQISKREMTLKIFGGISKLEDVPEFQRYWSDVPAIKRDAFIASIVEEIFQ